MILFLIIAIIQLPTGNKGSCYSAYIKLHVHVLVHVHVQVHVHVHVHVHVLVLVYENCIFSLCSSLFIHVHV